MAGSDFNGLPLSSYLSRFTAVSPGLATAALTTPGLTGQDVQNVGAFADLVSQARSLSLADAQQQSIMLHQMDPAAAQATQALVEPAADDPPAHKSIFGRAWNAVYTHGIKQTFNAMNDASNGVQHAIRTGVDYVESGNGLADQAGRFARQAFVPVAAVNVATHWDDYRNSWGNTSAGSYDHGKITDLQKQYGDQVSYAQKFVNAVNGVGGMDPHQLLAKAYAADPTSPETNFYLAALGDPSQDEQPSQGGIIGGGKTIAVSAAKSLASRGPGENATTQEVRDLIGHVNAARRDNYGGMVLNAFLPSSMEGTSAVWTYGSRATNIASIWYADPTLIGGKAFKAYKFARLSLAKMGEDAGAVDRAFQRGDVTRLWDEVGKNVQAMNNAKTLAERAAARQNVQRLVPTFDNEVVGQLAAAKVHNATDAQRWLHDFGNITSIMRGQGGSSFGALMPTLSRARQARIAAAAQVRGVVDVDKVGRAIVDRNYLAQGDLATQADDVATSLLDRGQQIGTAESVTAQGNQLKRGKALVSPSSAANAWRAKVDRTLAKLGSAPTGSSLTISDASDARKVYQLARTSMSAYHARLLQEAWIEATPAVRRNMAAGLVKTMGYAKGIDDETLATFLKQVDPLSDESLYSVNKVQRPGQLGYGAAKLEDTPNAARGFEPMSAQRQIGNEQFDLIQQRKGLIENRKGFAQDSKDLTAGKRQANRVLNKATAGADADAQAAKAQEMAQAAQVKSIDRQIGKVRKSIAKMGDDESTIQQAQDYLATLQQRRDELGKAAGLNQWRIQDAGRKLNDLADEDPAAGVLVNFAAGPNGRQHALHLWQTSDKMAIPSYADMERLAARTGMLHRLTGLSQRDWAGTLVNAWSFATLAGPRTALRNSIEDWALYLATGGSARDLVAARRASTALREVRGAKLGLVNRLTNKVGDQFDGGFFGSIMRKNLDPEQVQEVQSLVDDAARLGKRGAEDPEVQLQLQAIEERMQGLFVEALAKQKLSKAQATGSRLLPRILGGGRLSGEDGRYLRELSSSMHGRHLLDEAGETARHWATGTEENSGRIVKGSGIYDQLPFTPGNPEAAGNYAEAWLRNVVGIVDQDGYIGKIAVRALARSAERDGSFLKENLDQAVQDIADHIHSAEGAKYRDAMTRFHEGESPEEFAHKYLADVVHYFTGPGGKLNKDLLAKVARRDEDGKWKVSARDPETGFLNLNAEDMLKMDSRVRPESVLAERKAPVEAVKNLSSFMSRGWTWMGDQTARMSREPVFLARYTAARRELAGLESRLAKDQGEEAASKWARDMAADLAYERTMAYTDNPHVRSVAALNGRNMARFYRATEDFYRRTVRLARYNPEAIRKLALTYNLMDETGFIHTDDQGQKYFIYPGMSLVNDAVARTLNAITPGNVFVPGLTSMWTGKVSMLSPSTDPNSAIPTFSGPFIATPMKTIEKLWPQSRQLEQFVLGSTSTNMTWKQAVLPPVANRVLSTLSTDERDAAYANAVASAARLLEANGKGPKPDWTQADYHNWKQQLGNTAEQMLMVKTLAGFVLPAAATVSYEKEMPDLLRQIGSQNFRVEFNQTVQATGGDYNKALAIWMLEHPHLAPYTVSLNSADTVGQVAYTDKAAGWLDANPTLAKEFPQAAAFLMPRDGNFDWSTYSRMQQQGYVKRKDLDSFLLEVGSADTWRTWNNARDQAQATIDQLQDPREVKLVQDALSEYKKQLQASDASFAQRTLQGSDAVANRTDALAQLRAAYVKGLVPNTGTGQLVASMLSTYDQVQSMLTQITGQDQQSTDMRKTVRAAAKAYLAKVAEGNPGAQDLVDSIFVPNLGG